MTDLLLGARLCRLPRCIIFTLSLGAAFLSLLCLPLIMATPCDQGTGISLRLAALCLFFVVFWLWLRHAVSTSLVATF